MPLVYRLFKPLTRSSALIFLLHRFEDPANGVQGHSAAFLDEALTFLKREGYNFVALADLIRSARGETPPLERAVCFTMDDGFMDQATIAVPIFKKHNCPVTVFLITGFIDGQLWPWDDQVRHLFMATPHDKIDINLGSRTLSYDFTQHSRIETARLFRELCKALPEEQMLDAVRALSEACSLPLTSSPPKAYQPMTWDTARSLEQQGVTFASHGVTHRIIARMTLERAKDEMTESWTRLKAELSNPLQAFCFSTGRWNRDFTARELAVLSDTDYQAGVSTDPSYVSFSPDSTAQHPIVLSRFTFPDDKTTFVQYSSGIEHMKTWLRTTPFSTLHDRFGGKTGFMRFCNYQIRYALGLFHGLRQIDWTRVTRLVFVCKGNICRSAFAEAVAHRAGINSISYGVDTRGGDPAEPRAVAMAREHGVDLTSHITQRTDDYVPRDGDLILAMEPDHLTALNKNRETESGAQRTLLGLWQPSPNPYIHDPYSTNDVYFMGCFTGIVNAVREIEERFSAVAVVTVQPQETH